MFQFWHHLTNQLIHDRVGQAVVDPFAFQGTELPHSEQERRVSVTTHADVLNPDILAFIQS
jgi:hypothetical protein